MTEFQTIPAQNPAELDSIEGLCNLIQDRIGLATEKVMPCKVVNYNRATNRAVLKPQITGVGALGQKISREQLYDIPVFSMHGGGIFLNFPCKAGDTGWVVTNDRDISIFKQNLEESAPNTYRKNRYVDAFFIPDKINNLIINAEDDNAFVISTDDGVTRFSLQDNLIKMTSQDITMEATTVTANTTDFIINASGNTNINAINTNIVSQVAITGNTTQTGTVNASGTITSQTDCISGTISGKTHTHGGVKAGSDSTDPPN